MNTVNIPLVNHDQTYNNLAMTKPETKTNISDNYRAPCEVQNLDFATMETESDSDVELFTDSVDEESCQENEQDTQQMNSQKTHKPFFLRLRTIASNGEVLQMNSSKVPDFDRDIKIDDSSDLERTEREYQESMLELVATFNQALKNRTDKKLKQAQKAQQNTV